MVDNPYYKVHSTAFNEMQLDAGVVLTSFDFTDPYTEPADEDILAVTSGGVNPVCEPQYVDLAEDVDNVPNNTKEYLRITGYNCSLSFTDLRFNPNNTKWAIGGSDIADGPEDSPTGTKKITPRIDLYATGGNSDFKNIYTAFPLANGGIYVVVLKNAISSGGLNIQSTKDGKGTSQVTLTGYISANNVKDVPMEFYVIPKQETETTGGETTGG